VIGAGSLNRALAIYVPTTVRSPTGVEKNTFAKLTTTWAERRSLSLKDATRAAGTDQSAEAKFVIRYRQGIDTSIQVECEGQRYSVEAVDEIGNREGLALLVRAI
jgi:SPP1 family predicted phage head-tail adaptor